MNVGFDKIKELLHGAVYTEEVDGLLGIHRFTKEQEEAYKPYNYDFYKKTFGTAGVRLSFDTNSTSLSLAADMRSASSRRLFSFDVYVNGALIKTARGNVEEEPTFFSFDAELGEGKKRVDIYFPWSVSARLRSFSVDDGAELTGVSSPHKMICFGDSITHGYDAINTSFSYASRLADALCADAVNKGIGGEIFFPTLAKLKDGIEPDYITVAYGTNDWRVRNSEEEFMADCKGFYDALSANYPNAKIFAITPIFRGSFRDEGKGFTNFFRIGEIISEVVAELDNVTVIDGFDLVPHDPCCFISDILHPNDEGFRHYANNLYAEIKRYL